MLLAQPGMALWTEKLDAGLQVLDSDYPPEIDIFHTQSQDFRKPGNQMKQ